MCSRILITIITTLKIAACSDSPAVVNVHSGSVAGTIYTLFSGREVYAFYGIPYAAPPMGERRYENPQPVEPWTGVWNATRTANKCLQLSFPDFIAEGSEDCLYLNVFTPDLREGHMDQRTLMDVFVYIHGGAYHFGSGNMQRPDVIMKYHDLVFVSMNYRLGALGFLSTGDTVLPGNIGLKDQIAALKWIQRNIHKFGGNPGSVTISGVSAGSSSVHYHYFSRLSATLFHKGMSICSTVLNPWALPKNNTERTIELAEQMGCPTLNSRHMVECLRQRPAVQIVKATIPFFGWQHSPFTVFGPVVEPYHADAFITEQPIMALKNKDISNLPWLITISKDEGLFPASRFIDEDDYLEELEQRWYEIAPELLLYSYSVRSQEERNRISAALRQYYIGDRPISRKTVKELIQISGDRHYTNGIISGAKLHAAASYENVFCIKLSYRGRKSLSDFYVHRPHNYGVAHGDIAQYIFTAIGYDLDSVPEDGAVGELISSMVRQFMKNGDPRIWGIQWDPVSDDPDDHLRCLEVRSSTDYSMYEYEHEHVIEFWENLIPSEDRSASSATEPRRFMYEYRLP